MISNVCVLFLRRLGGEALCLTPCVSRDTCFGAPHVAWRIVCSWLRFMVGFVCVFVELLRLFQGFDKLCLQRGRFVSWLWDSWSQGSRGF